MKKIIAMMLLVFMLMSLTACGTAAQSDDGTYVIGICQIMVHNSLDDATQGFKDAVVAGLGEDHVVFNHRDAGGEFTNCGTIMDGFVAEGVDLILADATAPLQAAQSATSEIPVLGNAVTDYATALNIADYHGTVGGNALRLAAAGAAEQHGVHHNGAETVEHIAAQRLAHGHDAVIGIGLRHERHDPDLLVVATGEVSDVHRLVVPSDEIVVQIHIQIEDLLHQRQGLIGK